MVRVEKKKARRTTKLSQLKKELKRVTDQLGARDRELAEALSQQAATAEVLGIISSSPNNVQPVLDAIVESAARVCGIDDVVLRLVEGGVLLARAHFGSVAIPRDPIPMDEPEQRWLREHGTLYVPDIRAQNDFPMLGAAFPHLLGRSSSQEWRLDWRSLRAPD